MSALMLDNGLVHYEAWGRRGQPIIFLHSWLGSWRYWVRTMEQVADHHRVYAFDFWGFGESECRGCQYSVDEYVRMLLDFIQKLSIKEGEVNLVGHGMGGLVAIQAARQSPALFSKVATVCTPLQGAVVGSVVHKTGGALTRLLGMSRPTNVWSRVLRTMNLSSDEVYKELLEDTDNLNERLVQSVLDSVITTDVTRLVTSLEVPLLMVFGDRDTVVSTEHFDRLRSMSWQLDQDLSDGSGDWETLTDTRNGDVGRYALMLRRTGHFPFVDQEMTFNRLLLDYMAPPDKDASKEARLTIKKVWKRRVTQREFL